MSINGVAFISILGAAVASAPLAAQAPGGPIPKALDRPVAHYAVTSLAIEDALAHLVGERARTFVIGFEQAAGAGATEPRISLRVQQGTVAEVLRGICSQDPCYTFSEPEAGVINVYPVDESADARAILNLPLSRVDVSVRDWPANLFARIAEFAPDLRAYLEGRAAEYQRRTRSSPPGSPGVTMTTDVAPPHIEIHLQQTTVRGALNAIAAYTLTHSFAKEIPNASVGASGWKFSFQESANAPTGLGGYPYSGSF
jgi:hypothetical protein